MTILQELAALYDARAEERGWPRPGFSTEKVGACVVLAEDGSVREIRPLMAPDAKGRMQARPLSLPAAVKRTAGIKPNRFWDKTAYVLGVTETPEGPGSGTRTVAEHEAFKAAHLDLLDGAEDPALHALRRFCETWSPECFAGFPDAATLVDENVVFRLGDGRFVHDLPAAQALLAGAGEGDTICLVSGRPGPVARLHPSIKGVMGAQPAGASLVSFNNDAETSHGKKQGDNAPVSEAAASAYGTALNALLAKGSGNNLRIGGDTVAFWAEDAAAEEAFHGLFAGEDPKAEAELRARLLAVAEGRARGDNALDPDARLFVLGLAPNAARLAVRYWHPGTVKGLADAVSRFWSDMAIAPSPFVRGGVELPPKPWALLYDLAAQHDARNIPAGLGGDLMRAILTGGRYPATLLSNVIGRLRVEGEPEANAKTAKAGNVDGRRAAMIAAVLRRNSGYQRRVPMDLDDAADMAGDEAMLPHDLGRLFAAFAYAERTYQKRGADLRQKYMAAASATPARVFPILLRGYEHNLASLAKSDDWRSAAGHRVEEEIREIMHRLPAAKPFPSSLALEDQGMFFVGFYQQDRALRGMFKKDKPLSEEEGEGA